MSVNRLLSNNRFAVLSNENAEVPCTSEKLEKKGVGQTKKKKKRGRKSKKGKQSVSAPSLKGSHPFSLPATVSRNDIDGERETIVSPTAIRESTNIIGGKSVLKPRSQAQEDLKRSAAVRVPNPKVALCQEKEYRSKRIKGNRGREYGGENRKSRPEFERPITWLIENMSRIILGNATVEYAQLFYANFSTYNEMLKVKSKRLV